MRAIAIAISLAMLAGTARADDGCICELFAKLVPDNPTGVGWGDYELVDLVRVGDEPPISSRVATETPAGGIANELLAGVRIGGVLGGRHAYGYHAELDLLAGATFADSSTRDHGGFAYDVALYPIGIGVHFGETSAIALGTGIVATGATRWLDDGVGLPVQATVQLGSGRVRVLGRARIAMLAGTHDDGAPSLPFTGEFEATLGVRIGHHYRDWDFPSANGYFIAAAYKEMLGDRYVGLAIGYELDAGIPH
ncbi:MAG TPA: hypothetical protein VGL61_18440 [Kofleriaceae bacterium]|jgi:hypothetical protein